eukprot:CAMPEP_0117052708 /NCGR_PEP_ID=MMETSP0472-20121206/36440_1 /TAXON_ID=693140 ORGANISM="Tiarina fusus, Strain LIS" /NCGR_SAMPLE_ID=MMETSP0472 /ASSEMBLY_ACC=CAM_ASM_000603 /LENGTH=231 /DNA_ID=CAMNT_0004767451 /DNA_START=52 /DNA_END=744 /DNA_ORIENTATION=-
MPAAKALKAPAQSHIKPSCYVSLRDWKLGVLVLGCLACLRAAFVWSGDSSPIQVPWTDSFQFDDTRESMLHRLRSYCHVDATVLCWEEEEDDPPLPCLHAQHVHPTLTLLWGNNCMNTTFERLTKYKWWNVTIQDEEIEKALSENDADNKSKQSLISDPETKRILQLFVYTFAIMYQRSVEGGFFGDLLSFSPPDASRLVRHYLMAVLDMFGNSKTTGLTVQTWTQRDIVS